VSPSVPSTASSSPGKKGSGPECDNQRVRKMVDNIIKSESVPYKRVFGGVLKAVIARALDSLLDSSRPRSVRNSRSEGGGGTALPSSSSARGNFGVAYDAVAASSGSTTTPTEWLKPLSAMIGPVGAHLLEQDIESISSTVSRIAAVNLAIHANMYGVLATALAPSSPPSSPPSSSPSHK